MEYTTKICVHEFSSSCDATCLLLVCEPLLRQLHGFFLAALARRKLDSLGFARARVALSAHNLLSRELHRYGWMGQVLGLGSLLLANRL